MTAGAGDMGTNEAPAAPAFAGQKVLQNQSVTAKVNGHGSYLCFSGRTKSPA